MRFYLGTDDPYWLNKADRPLFVSTRRLEKRLPTKPAVVDWALDSGGFTELSTHGAWQTGPDEYADRARRYADRLGRLTFAAIQDWMCEPWIVERTGRTIDYHQHATVDSWLTLTDLAPDIPWIPVLQGWTLTDYERHLTMYAAAGVTLTDHPTIGLGSVCRRQATTDIAHLIAELAATVGHRLHGFGIKTSGLRAYGGLLASADSMAWSYAGRKRPNPTHHPKVHQSRSCAHCWLYARTWAEAIADIPIQTRLAV